MDIDFVWTGILWAYEMRLLLAASPLAARSEKRSS
jgi:hypothetical protein